MDLDTKTNVIRQLEAELWKLTSFEFLGGNRWSGVVVPAIFGISILKKKPSKCSCFLHKVHDSVPNCYISSYYYTHDTSPSNASEISSWVTKFL